MRRREILAVLGTTSVAFAGCLADISTDRDSTQNDDGTEGKQNHGNADGTLVVEHFDSKPSRPSCEKESETIEVEQRGDTREYQTAETIPYPDPLTEFGQDNVVDYVKAFENAYVTHDVLCDRNSSGHILRVSYSVQERKTFNWYDDITVVYLLQAAGATSGLDGEGYLWEADIGFEGVVYAVDETGVARVPFNEAPTLEGSEVESQAPDPLEEGDLVATF